MRKVILLINAIVFSCLFGFSQDIITKTNGEDIKAKVLEVEQTQVKYKRFDNLDGPIFTIQKLDILMIRYENGTKDIFNTSEIKNTTPHPKYQSYSNSTPAETNKLWEGNGEGMSVGGMFSTDIGYYIGGGDYGYDRFGMNIIYSHLLNPFFGIGFGTGIRAFTGEDLVLIPFYANIKGYLMDNDVSPYLSLNIGYSADISGEGQSGLNLSPKIGVFKRVSNKSTVYFELGYEMQTLEFYTYNYSGNGYYSNENSGALCFNIGYTF